MALINFNLAAFNLLLLLALLSHPASGPRTPGEAVPASVVVFDRDDRLQAEADDLLPLFDRMPAVPVYLTDEPILRSGTNTESGVAYTHCVGHEIPSIFVKKDFYRKTNRKQLTNILKHEMTHAWLCRQRLMSGHDGRFRRKFEAIGGFGN